MNDVREALNYYKMSIENYDLNPLGHDSFKNHLRSGYKQCRDTVMKY